MEVLEHVHKRATELGKGLKNMSNEKQLRELRGLSLEDRRVRGTFSLCAIPDSRMEPGGIGFFAQATSD